MGEFYGCNIFMVEILIIFGGLDLLLDLYGNIKMVMDKVVVIWNVNQIYFVINGILIVNKIVVQVLICFGDIVFIDCNCYKLYYYGLVFVGVYLMYFDVYLLLQYVIYGVVLLCIIKQVLLDFEVVGQLYWVCMLLFINCMFDGVVYNLCWVMEEVLVI